MGSRGREVQTFLPAKDVSTNASMTDFQGRSTFGVNCERAWRTNFGCESKPTPKPGGSPQDLQAHLSDPRIARAGDRSKIAAAEISVWAVELRVIEHVEELRAKLHGNLFGDPGVLVQRYVGIVEARPMEEHSVGIAEAPQ